MPVQLLMRRRRGAMGYMTQPLPSARAPMGSHKPPYLLLYNDTTIPTGGMVPLVLILAHRLGFHLGTTTSLL